MKRFLMLVTVVSLLAMVVALAHPNVAGAVIQDEDECPDGTKEVAEINQNNSDTTTFTNANGQTITLTYNVTTSGVTFSTNPPSLIDTIVFKGPDSTIQYSGSPL